MKDLRTGRGTSRQGAVMVTNRGACAAGVPEPVGVAEAVDMGAGGSAAFPPPPPRTTTASTAPTTSTAASARAGSSHDRRRDPTGPGGGGSGAHCWGFTGAFCPLFTWTFPGNAHCRRP